MSNTVLEMSPGNITIREGNPSHFSQILELIHTFSHFQKTPDKVTVTLEQMIADQDLFKCIVAEKDGKVIGFASYFFAYYSWSGKGLYIDDLYVKDEYRQQQVGKTLWDALLNLGKQHQCKSVRWLVSRWNENAIRFYEKSGATIDDTDMPCIYHLS